MASAPPAGKDVETFNLLDAPTAPTAEKLKEKITGATLDELNTLSGKIKGSDTAKKYLKDASLRQPLLDEARKAHEARVNETKSTIEKEKNATIDSHLDFLAQKIGNTIAKRYPDLREQFPELQPSEQAATQDAPLFTLPDWVPLREQVTSFLSKIPLIGSLLAPNDPDRDKMELMLMNWLNSLKNIPLIGGFIGEWIDVFTASHMAHLTIKKTISDALGTRFNYKSLPSGDVLAGLLKSDPTLADLKKNISGLPADAKKNIQWSDLQNAADLKIVDAQIDEIELKKNVLPAFTGATKIEFSTTSEVSATKFGGGIAITLPKDQIDENGKPKENTAAAALALALKNNCQDIAKITMATADALLIFHKSADKVTLELPISKTQPGDLSRMNEIAKTIIHMRNKDLAIAQYDKTFEDGKEPRAKIKSAEPNQLIWNLTAWRASGALEALPPDMEENKEYEWKSGKWKIISNP